MTTTYTRITSESWLARVGRSVMGVVVGGLLFVGAIVLLFWNEGRAVTTARSLAEGMAAVVSIDPSRIDPANEGKLVHLTAEATTDQRLADELFGFRTSVPAVRLHRTVEMYQWKENRRRESRRRGGSGREETVTTYSYNKGWDESLIDSEKFGQGGHHNPRLKPFPSRDIVASPVRFGAFVLPESLVMRINDWQPVPVDEDTRAAMREDLREKVKVVSGRFYLPVTRPTDPAETAEPDNPAEPVVGDARVSFEVVRPTTVSVVARQVGNTFEPYRTKAGHSLMFLRLGARSAADIFAEEQAQNVTLAWLLRAAGFAGLWIGLAMVLAPLKVLADAVPPFGALAGIGVGLVTFLVAAVVGLVTVSLGWLFYRPLVGVVLIVVAGGLIVLMRTLAKKRAMLRGRPARQSTIPLPPVPTA